MRYCCAAWRAGAERKRVHPLFVSHGRQARSFSMGFPEGKPTSPPGTGSVRRGSVMVGLGRHYAMLGPGTSTGQRLLKGLVAISNSEQARHGDVVGLGPQRGAETAEPMLCMFGQDQVTLFSPSGKQKLQQRWRNPVLKVPVSSFLVSVCSHEPQGTVFMGWASVPTYLCRRLLGAVGHWELGCPTPGFRGQVRGDLRTQASCVLG